MPREIRDILNDINILRTELETKVESRRQEFGLKVEDGLASFEQGITAEHRKLRVGMAQFLTRSSIATILTAPLIYSLIIPFLLIDAWTTIYQAICFRAYRISMVPRAEYIKFDRRKLRYLNWIEALNCAFCSYAIGVIDYVREVGSRTEQYWCPIKHMQKRNDPHHRYHGFVEYGDGAGYRTQLTSLRDDLRDDRHGDPDAGPQPSD